MSDASTATIRPRTIRESEAEHFGALAKDWWDPKGSSAMLHRLNPVRLKFIRDAIDLHWALDPRDVQPLAERHVLDIGCGAGLLCEPLARMGGEVTGVDAAPENIAVAIDHAARMGLTIDYRAGEIGQVGLGNFDLVTCLEVVEHVADKTEFLAQAAACLAPGGLMIVSTPNRTAQSRLLMVGAAEVIGAIPRGTHDWDDFVTPDELAELLKSVGMTMGEPKGIAFGPSKGLHLSDDLSLNYIATARRTP